MQTFIRSKMRSRTVLLLAAIVLAILGVNVGLAQVASAGTTGGWSNPNLVETHDQSPLRERIINSPESIKLLRFDDLGQEQGRYWGTVFLYPSDNQIDSAMLYGVYDVNEQDQQQLRMLALSKGITFETGNDISGLHESDIYKMLTDNPSSIKVLDFQPSRVAGKIHITLANEKEYTVWIGASTDQDALTKLADAHGVHYNVGSLPFNYAWVGWGLLIGVCAFLLLCAGAGCGASKK